MSDLVASIRTFTLERLKPRAEALGVSAAELDDGFPLMESGLIDSMGFVELIAAVETEFDLQMDFEDLDLAKVASLGGFVRAAAGSRVEG